MAVAAWVLGALMAGILGWMGRPVMALLPVSRDAESDAPAPIVISRRPHLAWWLAGTAILMVTILFLALPASLMPGWVIVCGVGTWLAYIDWHTKVLPTRIVAPLFVAALLAVALEAWVTGDELIILRGLFASVFAYGAFWFLWWIANLRGKSAFGFGDVRFAAPLGLVLGSISPWAAPVGLYLGFVVGAVIGVAMRVRGSREGFAFGPAMLVGAVIGAVLSA